MFNPKDPSSFKERSDKCLCSTQRGLFVERRQLSFVVAGFIFLLFCSFVTGYFIARRHTIEEYCNKVEQESFADQVYTSLCTLYEQEPDSLPVQYAQDEPLPDEDTMATTQRAAAPLKNESTEQVADSSTTYRAELIGFGTAKAAQSFAQKLLKKGLPVVVKRRVSTTAKGKKTYWYQVIIDQYADRDELEKIVAKIAFEERIKGTRIVAC